MTTPNGKDFKVYIFFVGGLITFTISVILTYDYITQEIATGQRTYALVEFFTVIIILISVVYLARIEVVNNETAAALIGSVAGYVLGSK